MSPSILLDLVAATGCIAYGVYGLLTAEKRELEYDRRMNEFQSGGGKEPRIPANASTCWIAIGIGAFLLLPVAASVLK